MNPAEIEEAFRSWWLDSYKRPPNVQTTMTHVAFAEHLLALIDTIELSKR